MLSILVYPHFQVVTITAFGQCMGDRILWQDKPNPALIVQEASWHMPQIHPQTPYAEAVSDVLM
jgi:hypothetical protein